MQREVALQVIDSVVIAVQKSDANRLMIALYCVPEVGRLNVSSIELNEIEMNENVQSLHNGIRNGLAVIEWQLTQGISDLKSLGQNVL